MRTAGTVTVQPDEGTPLLLTTERETTHLLGRPVTIHETLTIRWVVDGRAQSVRAILAAPLELDGIP